MTDTSSAVPFRPGISFSRVRMTALMSSWLRSRSALRMRVVNMMALFTGPTPPAPNPCA